MRLRFRIPILVAALPLATALVQCGVLNRISGTDTVDLRRATIRRMNVALRKADQTICPREQVQVGVFMTAIPEGGKDEKTYETWAGRGAVNKNDHLDFNDFTFQSDQGQFDKDGWFAPIQSLPATAGHEIVVHATYTPSPLIFTYTYKWKPDYACVTSAVSEGQAGAPGGVGKEAAPSKLGDGGGVMSSGGDGHDGSVGGVGADGTSGGPGPKVHAVVTYVKTPFYDKLVGVRLTGAVTDILLFNPGQPFVIHVNGGPGGPGGTGGKGGHGGDGAAGNPGGHGGNGGIGGTGGKGGSGGAGGAIDLVYDARFPDLASAVGFDVNGGSGGAGGKAGGTGDPGVGGKGLAPQNSPSGSKDGGKGHEGGDGAAGAPGHTGPNGTAAAHAGSVGDAFAGLTDITGVPEVKSARPGH
jgi:hypothetical protein